jgi:hypothetical protein
VQPPPIAWWWPDGHPQSPLGVTVPSQVAGGGVQPPELLGVAFGPPLDLLEVALWPPSATAGGRVPPLTTFGVVAASQVAGGDAWPPQLPRGGHP